MNCPHCGATNYLQTGMCWRCGQPFVAAGKEGDDAYALEAPTSLVEQAPPAPDAPIEAVTFDLVEQAETKETEHPEPARAEAVIEGEQPNAAPIPEAPTLKCNNCGTGIHPAAQVCWKCGAETPNYTDEVRRWYERKERERYEREQEAAILSSMTDNNSEIRGSPRKKITALDAAVIAVIFSLLLGYSYVKSWPCSPCFGLALIGLLIILRLAHEPPKEGSSSSGGYDRNLLSDRDHSGGDGGFTNQGR